MYFKIPHAEKGSVASTVDVALRRRSRVSCAALKLRTKAVHRKLVPPRDEGHKPRLRLGDRAACAGRRSLLGNQTVLAAKAARGAGTRPVDGFVALNSFRAMDILVIRRVTYRDFHSCGYERCCDVRATQRLLRLAFRTSPGGS